MWRLNITREDYKLIYAGTSMEGKEFLFETKPTSMQELMSTYLPSKLWRMCNIYSILDKRGNKCILNLNRAQHITYANSLRHPRLIILKSRQQGISTFWLISFLDDALTIPNMTCGLMAQDLPKAADLLERIDFAYTNLHSDILGVFNVKMITNNSKVTAFSNGSKMHVSTSFRSGTLTRLHISELGPIARNTPMKAKETMSGSLQTIAEGNTVIIESTAEGLDNIFGQLWTTSVNVEEGGRSAFHFMPQFLGWTEDPDCNVTLPSGKQPELLNSTKEYITKVERELNISLTESQKRWVEAKRLELGDDYNKEYPYNPASAFALALDGSYYGKLFTDLISRNGLMPYNKLYTPALDVEVSFDIGINDTFVMLFWQSEVLYTGKLSIKLIDAVVNSGEPLSYYTNELDMLGREKGYKYNKFILPHDAEKRELGSALTISQQLFNLGLRRQIIMPRVSITSGIQAVRQMFPFMEIANGLDYVHSAFKSYSKEWDNKLSVWKDKPLHNEWSNPMDACRYYALYKISDIQRAYGSTSSTSYTKNIRNKSLY